MRATWYRRLKAHDQLQSTSSHWSKGRRPSKFSSHSDKGEGLKVQKEDFMDLHGVLHGGLLIRFHGLPKFSCCPPPRDGPDENSRRTWFFWFFFQQDRFQDKLQRRFHNIFQDRFQDRQTPPSISLKLIEFEKYYIKPNPPLFFRQQNMQWSRNMVHSHFTLCLRARDYIKWLSHHPWYGLCMRVKGPHHYKVMALGSCVKWPLPNI